MPPLAAELRGTALYCSMSPDTSCVGGGSDREKRSSGCDWHAVARFCAHRPSAVRVAISLPPGSSCGPRWVKCPGTPLGWTHSTLLQTQMITSLGLGRSLGIGGTSWGQVMMAVIYIGADRRTRAVPSQLHTTCFRSRELRLPLPRPGAFLARLSLAYVVHTTNSGRGWWV